MNETTAAAAIAPDVTVNELIRLYPGTVQVFNEYGIDACCGGSVPVREAAARDGADPAELVEALLHVVREEA
jgi:iron-sulfur cluster repair protein YtfE (RIC family)